MPATWNADTSQLAANSGLDFGFNYIRNSVKAVVNAYDGSMQFYRIDDTNPDPVVGLARLSEVAALAGDEHTAGCEQGDGEAHRFEDRAGAASLTPLRS